MWIFKSSGVLSVTRIWTCRIENTPTSADPSFVYPAARAMTPPIDARHITAAQIVDGIRVANHLWYTYI